MSRTCIDCENRHIGCHDYCKDYHEYRRKIEKTKQDREAFLEYNGYMAECLWKNKRV